MGEEVSVGGTWDGEAAVLHLAWIEHRGEGRALKRWLGVLGLVVAFGLLPLGVQREGHSWGLRG